jgi:hypothetical protein
MAIKMKERIEDDGIFLRIVDEESRAIARRRRTGSDHPLRERVLIIVEIPGTSFSATPPGGGVVLCTLIFVLEFSYDPLLLWG